MTDLGRIHVAFELLAILLFLGYLGYLFAAVIRLNRELAADRKIGCRTAFFRLDSLIQGAMASSGGRQSSEYRMLMNARRMYSLAVYGLLVAVVLDLARWLITP